MRSQSVELIIYMFSPRPNAKTQEDSMPPSRPGHRSSSHRRSSSYYADELSELTSQALGLNSNLPPSNDEKSNPEDFQRIDSSSQISTQRHHPLLKNSYTSPVCEQVEIIEPLDIRPTVVHRRPNHPLLSSNRHDFSEMSSHHKRRLISVLRP